jgi:hypothetical protein
MVTLADSLAVLESHLDPAHPERTAGLQVIGYGEISVALCWDEMPGTVLKRLSGFSSEPMARAHAALVEAYLARLGGAGVRVVDTDVVVVPRPRRPPVVVVVQPLLPAERLGHALAARADDALLASLLWRVLDVVLQVRDGGTGDGVEMAVDAQLSNWCFDDSCASSTASPVLFDVGTPFLRRPSGHALDRELILAAAPPPVRPYFRAARTVEGYLDDYFDPRTAAVDLVGNFHKEGFPARIGAAVEIVNDWLRAHRSEVDARPVTVAEVERYYATDAGLLELYLRLRRVDRFVRRRVLHRSYDFVLPGPVRR